MINRIEHLEMLKRHFEVSYLLFHLTFFQKKINITVSFGMMISQKIRLVTIIIQPFLNDQTSTYTMMTRVMS